MVIYGLTFTIISGTFLHTQQKRIGEMGRHATGNRKYSIQKIWDRHNEIIRLILLGQDNISIARELGVTPQNVSDVRNSPIVRERLEILQEERDASAVDISKRISRLAPKALDVMDEILRGEAACTAGDRLRAAVDVLDRGGYSAPQRHEHVHGVLTGKELLAIKKRVEKAKEIAEDSGEVQDAEIVE